MKVMIRTRGMDPSDALARHCERRLAFALGRFRGVDRIGVRLDDVNGPRGGEDIVCLAIAYHDARSPIVVRAVAGDAYAAVDLAAAKLAEVIARVLHRARRDRVVVPLRAQQRALRRARASAS
jgi:putative sigma-54 modulation protein